MKIFHGVTIFLACLGMSMSSVWAGAWTLGQGQSQIIAEVGYSHADRQFSDADRLSFRKLFVKDLYEYAWSDTLTVFSSLQYVRAQTSIGRQEQDVRNFAFEAGGRQRLMAGPYGVVSLQGAVVRAQPYTMTAAQGGVSGNEAEVRMLYGYGFALWQADGFVDIETAWRLTSYPRPNEAIADASLGVWVRPDSMLLLQSYNTISAGYEHDPYTGYRLNKIEISLVQKVTHSLSLQFGGVWAVGGSHVVIENGLTLSAWLAL